MRHKTPDLKAILDTFIGGYLDPEMHNYLNFLAFIVGDLQPKNILEIGSGDGLAARMMIQMMHADSSIITVVYPGQVPHKLSPWKASKRLEIVAWDEEMGRIDPLDLLFIHEVPNPCFQWETYRQAMNDGGVVLVDAINRGAGVNKGAEFREVSVRKWWDGLPYNKVETTLHGEEGFGAFVYDRSKA